MINIEKISDTKYKYIHTVNVVSIDGIFLETVEVRDILYNIGYLRLSKVEKSIIRKLSKSWNVDYDCVIRKTTTSSKNNLNVISETTDEFVINLEADKVINKKIENILN